MRIAAGSKTEAVVLHDAEYATLKIGGAIVSGGSLPHNQ